MAKSQIDKWLTVVGTWAAQRDLDGYKSLMDKSLSQGHGQLKRQIAWMEMDG